MDTMMSDTIETLASLCQPMPKENANRLLQFKKKKNNHEDLQKTVFAAIWILNPMMTNCLYVQLQHYNRSLFGLKHLTAVFF